MCLYAAAFPQPSLPDVSQEHLSLLECINIALSKNPGILISQANVAEKEEIFQGAQKDRYPTLSTYYQYDKNLDSIYYPEEDFYGYGITVKQPIYVGKSIVTAIELGAIDKESARYSHQATINTVTLNTYEAYYSLLKAERLENVSIQSVELLESHRQDAQAFFDAGLIPKNDLLASELQLAQGQQDMRKATNFTLLAKSALNVILQRPPAAPISIMDDVAIHNFRDLSWENILQLAQNRRPEVKQYELAIEMNEKNKVMTKAPYLPSVVFSASYGKQGDTPLADSNPSGSSEVRSAGAVATWQFWSWGQKNNKMAAAEHRVEKAKESLRQLQESIVLEARQAFLAAGEAQKNIAVTEKAIEQAEENYRIVQGRFQAQLATSTAVLDAQTLLTSARSNYFNALYDYRIALARLDHSTGTLVSTRE